MPEYVLLLNGKVYMAKAGKRKPKAQKWTTREYQVMCRAARIRGIPVGTLIRTRSLAWAKQFLKVYDGRRQLQQAQTA